MSDAKNEKRIFFKLEKVNENELKLDLTFKRDDEKFVYIMGIASTPDENEYGFVVENEALLEAWRTVTNAKKNIAVYEKHREPIGKVVACEEMNDKILVVLEIPRSGNERFLSVYEQGIYIGLSIGGWTLDWEQDDDDVIHVTKFEWYEVSVTDIPANENATLLEFMNNSKLKPAQEQKIKEADVAVALENIKNQIGGIK